MDRSDAFQFIGVGLRTPHLDYFEANAHKIGWLEVHSENYFLPHSPQYRQLRAIREQVNVSCHGIGLSLGSSTGVCSQHIDRLKRLIHDIEPCLVSDHLSWSEHGGHYFNDLLPLPYTEEALSLFCRNVSQVQDAIQRPLLIENPSSYLRFNHSTIPEWEFLAAVQRSTGCRLLLDLNNIHVSCFNHSYDAQQYLAAIDPATVDEIHLAGFTRKRLEQGEIWIDTHSAPVSDEVWHLYQQWLSKHGPVATLIEWDLDIPAPEVLLQEANTAKEILLDHATCFEPKRA
ncbi:DUF692 domain-containing protein [Vibrio hangzhouensis]|uniref:Uncharacterized protein n=1 Tax=Vibrio hangzhouensis TaxID=462991 RepID=A0A1H6CJ99_9VIBR|nr:DUF692 domain-containing protein [Vibrio hangzhouensis]SEG72476.1 hypothetical protein SAMN04488244_14019 [Vibrio hangzhouensis]